MKRSPRWFGCHVAVLAGCVAIGVSGGPARGGEPCEAKWIPTFGSEIPGVDGEVHAFATFDDGDGPALYVGGDISRAGGADVNNIARWDGESWTALGAGVNNSVYALAVFDDGDGPALYAGGQFTTAGGSGASRIARWDGESWSAIGGADGVVRSLAVFDDGTGPALFVGGQFSGIGGVNAAGIVRRQGGVWSGVGDLDDGRVRALHVFDDGSGPALYAGGTFTGVDGVSASRVARWDGNAWTALGSGVNSEVRALETFDDGTGPALYAGGTFTNAGGSTAFRLARWDGAAWSAVGSTGNGANSQITALAVHDDGSGPALYVGGWFTQVDGDGRTSYTGGIEAHRVARWSGTEWSALPNMSPAVTALTTYDDGVGQRLYAGHDWGVSVLTPSRWEIPANQGLVDGAGALVLYDDGMGGDPMLAASTGRGLRFWDGESWSEPVGRAEGGLGTTDVLLVFDDGSGPALVAAGDFTSYGETAVNNIAVWDGESWAPLGDGLNGRVRALAYFDDGSGPALYAAGAFTEAGGVVGSHVARWDGASWSAVGDGAPSTVWALIEFDDGSGPALYAGGRFHTPAPGHSESVIRWDGAAWSLVGDPLDDWPVEVRSFGVHHDGFMARLYAAGTYGGGESGLWIWDGASWETGTNLATFVDTPMTSYDDGTGPKLFIAFGDTGGPGGFPPSASVHRRVASLWENLGQFTGEVVVEIRAMLAVEDGPDGGPSLYVGGSFADSPGGDVGIARLSLCMAEPCIPDFAPPFGVLDVFDVLEFLALFEAGDPGADLAPPFGVLDVFDVLEFLALFEQGCP